MVENRLRAGPFAATVGAALLALSVFQPWYTLRLTPAGANSARQALNSVALQFGNAAFKKIRRTAWATASARWQATSWRR